MFEYMTTSQIVAFFFGIGFSIISIATTLLAVKHAERLNSFFKTLMLALFAPFVAITSWLFICLSFTAAFAAHEFLALASALAIAVVVAAVIIIVAKSLYNRHPEQTATAVETDEVVEEPAEMTEEQILATALLIANTENAKEEQEEQEIAQNEVEEVAEEENEEVEEVTEEETVEETEVGEEETEEETTEEETTEENEEITENVEEAEEETTEEETTEETEIDENVDFDTDEEDPLLKDLFEDEDIDFGAEEITAEETTEEDEMSDDDKEFEKFLEALRKRKQETTDSDDENK